MHGEVLRTEELTPHLQRVVFGGPGLDAFEPVGHADSYVNAFFLPLDAPYTAPFDEEAVRELPRDQRPVPRRYTVRAWDPARRELTIDFVVHGDVGFAGRWARHAQPGDTLQMRGPAGSYAQSADSDWHLLVGDESALPAIAAVAEQASPDAPVLVVVEVAAPGHEVDLHSPGELSVTWVYRSGGGAREDLLLRAVAELELPTGRAAAFVHGEAVATRAVRTYLLRNAIVDAADLSCSPYWRRGYTDEEWRSVKREWVRSVELDDVQPQPTTPSRISA